MHYVFLESPAATTRVNLRNHLDNELKLHYRLDFDSVQRYCTITNDCVAAMAKMAYSSISRRKSRHDER